ncbi:MAG: DUF2007 domain-containing protein [Acidobacteriota bacterium]
MKYLFAPNNMIDRTSIEMLKAVLQKDGIPFLVRNENLSMALGEVAFPDTLPEIWILNDIDFPRAHEMLEAWRKSAVETRAEWLCSKCGETIEGQFTSCWKCGNQREES